MTVHYNKITRTTYNAKHAIFLAFIYKYFVQDCQTHKNKKTTSARLSKLE